jgi:peroxiredoxin
MCAPFSSRRWKEETMGEADARARLAPSLTLPDTTGEARTLPAPGEAPATVVFWTCNHCPYALGWHDRFVAAANDYADRGVRFLAVNSNDPGRYKVDSPDAMRERVEREEWPFPYLWDETQEAAREWNAQVTPHVFVLDSDLRVRYEGAPDADHRDSSFNAAWLREALDAVLAGADPPQERTEPVGCSIKWRQ